MPDPVTEFLEALLMERGASRHTLAAYRTDLSKKAVAALKAQGVDVTGKSYKPAIVALKEGGK